MRMLKRYTARYKCYSVYIRLNDKPVCLRFLDGYFTKGSKTFAYYVTSNEAVQKALESLPMFGKEFILKSGKELPEATQTSEKEVVEKKIVESVTTLKEAMDYMVNECGLKVIQCNTKAKLEKRMPEFGLEFPNLKY